MNGFGFAAQAACVSQYPDFPSQSFRMLVVVLLFLLAIYQRALLFVSESTQRNYKTSGAFNLLLISQQL